MEAAAQSPYFFPCKILEKSVNSLIHTHKWEVKGRVE